MFYSVQNIIYNTFLIYFVTGNCISYLPIYQASCKVIVLLSCTLHYSRNRYIISVKFFNTDRIIYIPLNGIPVQKKKYLHVKQKNLQSK